MELRSISPRHAKIMSALKPVHAAAALWLLLLAALPALCQPANGVLLERWNNITGTTVASLTSNPAYPASPSTRSYTTLYEIPLDAADNYGTRTRGYITPPTSGNYTFWIAGDDNCELWLGTNADPNTVRRIAFVSGWTTTRQWTKYPEQQSAVIALTAGVRYFIETRHKESAGGDNMAVGWQGPGITGEAERPVPASRLTPFLLAPVITTQPANATVTLGQTASFTVAATGGSLSYAWTRNGIAIPGAVAATYATPPTTAADHNANYVVTVTNPGGSVASNAAVLTVNIPPTIQTQPAAQTVAAGASVTFSVVASGTAPLSYQWRRGAANIAGATGSSHTFTAQAADNGIDYSVVVSNVAGSLNSANARLTVTSAPVITTQPASQTVTAPAGATFSVVATGAGTLTYQWRRDGVSLPGQTGTSYTLASSSIADQGARFTVVVTNANGSTPSNDAVLTVLVRPAITTQPAGQTVNLGQPATFSVVATGTPTPNYQWRRNGTAIAGAVSAIYTTPNATLADQGARYSVFVSNSAGDATSADALLTVLNNAPNNKKIAISGELVNAAGDPVGFPAPVTVDAVVVLYNALTAGTAAYTEEFRAAQGKGILVQNGLFVARLGEGVTGQNLQQVLSANANLWAEITIHDGTPDVLAPRTPITAAAYSLGGTPAPVAGALQGAGNPNSLGVQGAVGAAYVNTEDNTTWLKLSGGWKAMD